MGWQPTDVINVSLLFIHNMLERLRVIPISLTQSLLLPIIISQRAKFRPTRGIFT